VAEDMPVGVLVPNLFLRVPVEAAVRAAGFRTLPLADSGGAAVSACRVVIADLEALGEDPAAAVRGLVEAGRTVLAFGPHVRGEMLAAARAAGAAVLPRSVFLARLPELLAAATGASGSAE
jgi:hypothetical protein